jgi:hypothetical protein
LIDPTLEIAQHGSFIAVAPQPLHSDGILNYCRTKVRFGVVEAINGNIKTLLRRGRGYKNLGYLLLKAQRMAVTRTEFIVLQKAA